MAEPPLGGRLLSQYLYCNENCPPCLLYTSSYKIDAALWGRGYGSEAIRYGTGWAFRVLGLHRAEANVMPRNAASLRAAEKAGYRPEGLARRYLNINGVWEDHIHMVKLNEEEYHA